MTVTQKLNGTNAQIYVDKESNQIISGSRNRYLSINDDNYGFAKFVEANREAIFELLGDGRQFGEWCGPGINSGEGLSEKRLLLFNHRRWIGKELPPNVGTVPVLYNGAVSMEVIDNIMSRLKAEGSYLVPGYKKVEGIVVELGIGGELYKKVFDPEETSWAEKIRVAKPRVEGLDVSHLLQPLRLQKLLTKDEAYLRDYPKSLGAICKAYVEDLIAEEQFAGDEETRKSLGKCIFQFVKCIIANRSTM